MNKKREVERVICSLCKSKFIGNLGAKIEFNSFSHLIDLIYLYAFIHTKDDSWIENEAFILFHPS